MLLGVQWIHPELPVLSDGGVWCCRECSGYIQSCPSSVMEEFGAIGNAVDPELVAVNVGGLAGAKKDVYTRAYIDADVGSVNVRGSL